MEIPPLNSWNSSLGRNSSPVGNHWPRLSTYIGSVQWSFRHRARVLSGIRHRVRLAYVIAHVCYLQRKIFSKVCKATSVTHTKRIYRNLLRKETSFVCYTSSVLRKSRHMKQKEKIYALLLRSKLKITNDKYKLELLQGDGSRTRQAIPQNARWKARACNCCSRGKVSLLDRCQTQIFLAVTGLWGSGEVSLLALKNV